MEDRISDLNDRIQYLTGLDEINLEDSLVIDYLVR